MIIAAVLPFPFLGAQNFEYHWQRVRMDSTYESSTVYPVDRIVAEHEEQMAPLMKVVIYSNAEIQEDQPESALTNLVADMLIHAAAPFIDNDYPTLSLTNMGGIRSNFPKGLSVSTMSIPPCRSTIR